MAPAYHDTTLPEFLEQLAARQPAPGGGAVAALHAALSAALLCMVTRYSTGPKYAAHETVIGRVLAEADVLREQALGLAEADAAAFTAVTDAYRLPKTTTQEATARTAAIAKALLGAAEPPATVIQTAERLVALAEALGPVGNRNVISDVAAAAEAARAAATTARINVEINLAGITDPDGRERLTATTQGVDAIVARAEQVTRIVREEIAR